jgi:iron complex outermembrane receptor protein
MRLTLALAATTCLVAVPAAAQTSGEETADNGFDLGRITVIGERPEGLDVTGATLSAEAMATFNRVWLDTALDLIPGANSSDSGGSRNERLIYVRGFDRFQVPLLIDGVVSNPDLEAEQATTHEVGDAAPPAPCISSPQGEGAASS